MIVSKLFAVQMTKKICEAKLDNDFGDRQTVEYYYSCKQCTKLWIEDPANERHNLKLEPSITLEKWLEIKE